jgi:exodeoxyribonuclease V gamma subunit
MSQPDECLPQAGLFVFRARRIERLAAVLAARLAPAPDGDPMAPVRVAVGSRGMARWLRQELAGRLGIAANLSFQFPAQALEELLAEAGQGPAPGTAAWSSGSLTWAVLAALPGLLPRPEFEPLRRYLGAQAEAIDRRAWALARELADALDRYALYRREWTAAWARGELPAELREAPDAGWQAALWRALTERLGSASFDERLARCLAQPAPSTCRPLHVFGVSSLPPAYVEALAHQAEASRVELYLLCPSNLYWGDLRRGFRELGRSLAGAGREQAARLLAEQLERQNPLLTSLGRASRDFQGVLEELAPGYQEPSEELFAEPEEPAHLLAWLQADIQELRAPSAKRRPLAPGDDSLRVHACHGPTRQVEALREALLQLFADHPELEPRDVVVMTPALETFAPLVAAVFAREAAGAPAIPLLIDDRSAASLNPQAEALGCLLALVESRVTASAVMDLLALAPVRRRFGLSAEDLVVARRLVQESGVRWGIDGADRARAGQPESELHTWRFGLRRLALGAAMPDEGALFAGLLPYDDLEGERLEIFGRLAEAVERLFALLATLGAPRPMPDWVEALGAALESLTAVDEEEAWLREALFDGLTALGAEARAAGLARPITLEALARVLAQRFDLPAPWEPAAANAVNLCALQPMRSVPHRVVCLLGLDDGLFPRCPPSRGFDLTRQRPRLGDRDPRDEDRHLLLEALLSARDHLRLFYTGRDIHTGAPLPPAVPLGELLEAVEAGFTGPGGNARAQVEVVEPLQPFDARLFATTPGDAPRSFDPGMRAASERLRGPRAAPYAVFSEGDRLPAVDRPRLGLEELGAFLEHPARALLRDRLGLRLPLRAEALADREPVEQDGLGDWRLQDEMLALALAGVDEGDILPRVERLARARGELPPGGAGALAAAEAWRATHALLEETRAARAVPRGCEEFALAPLAPGLPGLAARCPGVGPEGDLLLLTPSSLEGAGARLMLRAWLALLALQAHAPRPGRRARVLGRGGESRVLAAPADSRGVLAALLGLYAQGTCRPLRLLPRTSAAFARALAGEPGPWSAARPEALARAAEAARRAWSGQGDHPGDAQDEYLRAAFGGAQPFALPGGGGLHPEFLELAWTVWGALGAATRADAE